MRLILIFFLCPILFRDTEGHSKADEYGKVSKFKIIIISDKYNSFLRLISLISSLKQMKSVETMHTKSLSQ